MIPFAYHPLPLTIIFMEVEPQPKTKWDKK